MLWIEEEIFILKNLSNKIKNLVKYIECFETKDFFYIIEEYYDDDLLKFHKREKKLSPNLIKKYLCN